MKYVGPFSGPSAPWVDDDQLTDSEALSIVERASSSLARSLEARAFKVRENPTLENLLLEVRAQIATATVTNHFDAIGELTYLMMELQALHENGTEINQKEPAVFDRDANDE